STLEAFAPLIPVGGPFLAVGAYWLRRSGRIAGAKDVTNTVRIARANSDKLDEAFNELPPSVTEWMHEKLPGYVERTVQKHKNAKGRG
ncbi:MAG: hypothetical protein KDB18_11655, partial [Salinibacterium sp.]|nr:hypothetical protein [Salinibacterium sp.]